ncbi:MAG TPA: pitrilysin family protein [Thermoanaerobaculia bacterium]|jgi:zinc protease|nr:pitrilysin family protein [Thermoanaerobaculia bacterium]
MSYPATPDLAFERHSLDNGLRIVLHRNAYLPLVAVNLWYHVGSRNERPGRTGFAHLFEHMLFQGSQHVPTHDHFRYIQQVGGVANGSTWFDRTNYYESLPAHQLDLALWLESDRMGFFLPALTQENLDTQREVVMNERRQRIENQPYGLAGERLHELLYPAGHPYHWPVIGYMEDIAAATLEEVRAFFRTYYTPNNSVLTLVGDFQPADALKRIEAWFGEIPAGPPVPPVTAPLPPLGGERRAVLPDDVRLPRVYIGFRAPAYGQRFWYAADLLAAVLAGGKSSPLYRELVYERQIAQDIGASVGPYESAGTFMLVATARPGVAIETLEEALLGAVSRAAAAPPEPADLERARNRMLIDSYSSLQKLDSLADLLSQFTTYFDDPGGVAGEAGRYLELTSQDLMDYAAGWCTEDERVIVSVVPRQGN